MERTPKKYIVPPVVGNPKAVFFADEDQAAAADYENQEKQEIVIAKIWVEILGEAKTLEIDGGKGGHLAILHPSTRRQGEYQLTLFGESGPISHMEATTQMEFAKKIISKYRRTGATVTAY